VEQDAASPVQIVADDVVQIPMAVCCHDESDGAVVGEVNRAHPGTGAARDTAARQPLPPHLDGVGLAAIRDPGIPPSACSPR